VTRRATVLAYHAIGSCSRADDRHNLFVTVEKFADQMAFLARRRRVVSLADAMNDFSGTGPPPVAITFDDGYRNVLHNAAPILNEHGFVATVFVPTSFTGKRNTWIEETPCDVDIMSESELQTIESMGVRVESHGHGHIDYAAATEDEAIGDLETSMELITEVTGHPVRFFAYPYGAHSLAAHEVARSGGLEAAFTIDEPGRDPFAYERVQVTPRDGMRLFTLKTSGRYMRIRHSAPVRAAYSAVKPVVRKLLKR
jgi:peptidoglycan/xylan/chitin deacetylase (PgdA/CDA1 family)